MEGGKISAWARVRRIVGEVSGIPPASVYRWNGLVSPIAWLFAAAFLLLRLLSPLQWLKFAWRRGEAGPDAGAAAGRRDFHARYTEIYFLVVLLFMVAMWLLLEGQAGWPLRAVLGEATADGLGFVLHGLVALLLLESFVWLSYYCLWRNLMEPGYTLYHPAEYLVLFPVVVAVQTLAISVLAGVDLHTLARALAGDGSPAAPAYAGLLGWYYLAVLFTNVAGLIPRPGFKRAESIAIIGAGAVTGLRILPALIQPMFAPVKSRLLLFSREQALPPAGRTELPVALLETDREIVAAVVRSAGAAIVATPPSEHFAYMKALSAAGMRVVVEKPLCWGSADIHELSRSWEGLSGNLFALSYYTLEKALPLTFLLDEHPAHLPFLQGSLGVAGAEERPLAGRPLAAEVRRIRARLGQPTAINLWLEEEPDRAGQAGPGRDWARAPGGLILETGIHLLLIAYKICDSFSVDPKPDGVVAVEAVRSPDDDSIDRIRLVRAAAGGGAAASGAGDGLPLDLIVSRREEATRRGGSVCFTNGRIDLDFDARTMIVTAGGAASQHRLCVGLKPAYALNYSVQMALALRFIGEGWGGPRYDELEDQVAVLRWLDRNWERLEATGDAPQKPEEAGG
jgi:predicted dehydrogenase